jgi:uncharacterized SAM-binding protein YcdF (DUF218 family)
LLHTLSKLTAFAFQPLAWVGALLLVGTALLMFTNRSWAIRWGRRACVAAMVLLLFVGWQTPPNMLLLTLEDQYAPPAGRLDDYVGMIVLGGAFGGPDGRDHRQPAIGCAGERIIIPVPLMAEYPHLKLVFAGGTGQILTDFGPEADVAKAYFERMGVDMTRVLFERDSRNTFENARNAAAVPGVDPKARWLLVTSAWHMPRAIATFRKAGWNVTAYPVDWMSSRNPTFSYDLVGGAWAWETWLRESLGLVLYRSLGRA